MSLLFDTNIVIDFINGVLQASTIFSPATSRMISVISWIEVMAGATPATESTIRSVLSTCQVIPIGPEIAERASILRQQTRLKLPDAIILATAPHKGRTLVTRNTRDFTDIGLQIHIPYTL